MCLKMVKMVNTMYIYDKKNTVLLKNDYEHLRKGPALFDLTGYILQSFKYL